MAIASGARICPLPFQRPQPVRWCSSCSKAAPHATHGCPNALFAAFQAAVFFFNEVP